MDAWAESVEKAESVLAEAEFVSVAKVAEAELVVKVAKAVLAVPE